MNFSEPLRKEIQEKPTQASRQRYTEKRTGRRHLNKKTAPHSLPVQRKTPPAYPFLKLQCQTAETQTPRSISETQKHRTLITRENPKMAPGTASSKWEPKFLYYRQRAFLARLARPDFAEILYRLRLLSPQGRNHRVATWPGR